MAKELGIGGAFTTLKPTTVTRSPMHMGGTLEAKWEGPLPKGWTDKSRAKFANSMAQGECGEDAAHPVKTCMDKIDGHVDDPGAFCASLHDRVSGTTNWRSGHKKS